MQLDLESGTLCRRTSDSRTCHATVSDSRWRRCYLVSGTKAQCEPSFKLRFTNPCKTKTEKSAKLPALIVVTEWECCLCRWHQHLVIWNRWRPVLSAVRRRLSVQSCRWHFWIRLRPLSSRCRTWWSPPKRPEATGRCVNVIQSVLNRYFWLDFQNGNFELIKAIHAVYHAFSCSGLAVWNSLPEYLRNSSFYHVTYQ